MKRYRTIVVDPPWEIGDFPANFGYVQGKPTPYSMMSVSEIQRLPVANLAAPEAHLYLWTIASHLRAAYQVAEAWGFEPMYPLVWCKPPFGQGLGGKFASNVEFVLFCRERYGAVEITRFLRLNAARAGLTAGDINAAMGTSDMAGWWLSKIPHRARIPTLEQWERLRVLIGFDDRHDEMVRLVNERRTDDAKVNTRWFEWPRGPHSAKPDAFLDMVEQVSPGPYAELFARRARLGWDYPIGDEALGGVAA